ncbi:VOC family protein [Hanstruepera ponticola]|uniref:VOC family protein n=1 Tax=Hanstruepera ponticola TaxID=2042995 RepID=UPI000CF186AF|nr:VOC family protein [Hanstruepera ponticola]
MDTSFHMSLPCSSIKDTKNFYVNSIGATLGRHTQNWIDVNLYGHQMTFIKAGKFDFNNPNYVFEGRILPSFHFGVIVDSIAWKEIYNRFKDTDLELVTKTTFLEGKLGQHTSFFIKDPNGYMLEFKCFKKPNETFKHS